MTAIDFRLRASLGNLELPNTVNEIIFEEFSILECPNKAYPVEIHDEDGEVRDVDWEYPAKPDYRYPVCDYYLEAVVKGERGNSWIPAEAFLTWALTRLRLYKAGHLWGTLFNVIDSTEPGGIVGFKDMHEADKRRHNQPPSRGIFTRDREFSIVEGDIEPLKRFVNGLATVPATNLGIAIRRFNQVFDRDVLEDRAVDLFIALESLLSENADAIRYKIALRASHLITANVEEQVSINSFLKKAYDCRSGIMHGADRDVEWLTARNGEGISNLDYLEDIVRRILRHVSERAMQGQILNSGNLDEVLFFQDHEG